MEKKLLELAVEIVKAQASMSKMTAEDIEQALVRVYNTLLKMRAAEEQGLSIMHKEPASQASGSPVASIRFLLFRKIRLPVWNAKLSSGS